MRFLVELSGEHPDLPRAEAVAAAGALGSARLAAHDPGVALLEAEGVDGRALAARLALSHAVSAHWFSTAATPRALVPKFGEIDLEGARFAVRGRRVEGSHPEFPVRDTEAAIGHVLGPRGRVDLSNPDVEVRFVVSEDVHVGALLARVDRAALEERAVKHRPFFHPVSIAPRYARALANLAGIRPGDRVVDPFCGTGGMALEAGLLGARVLASDLDPRMVVGTRDTLEHYGVTPVAVEPRDVGELPEFLAEHGGPVDAIITDPPYARASTTNREGVERLYDRFFHAARESLRPGGRVAAIFPDARHVKRAGEFFTVRESHALRVHGSMTRHFTVLQK